MLRFIFYIFVFYVVLKIVRLFVDPFFEKKEKVTDATGPKSKPVQKPTIGEYVEYEEIKYTN